MILQNKISSRVLFWSQELNDSLDDGKHLAFIARVFTFEIFLESKNMINIGTSTGRSKNRGANNIPDFMVILTKDINN